MSLDVNLPQQKNAIEPADALEVQPPQGDFARLQEAIEWLPSWWCPTWLRSKVRCSSVVGVIQLE